MICTLILIDCITKRAKLLITNKNKYTLFTIALFLSLKLNEDIIHKDKDFAHLAKLSISSLILLEKVFLDMINYDLFICEICFSTYKQVIFGKLYA